jgi:hypothetical protein
MAIVSIASLCPERTVGDWEGSVIGKPHTYAVPLKLAATNRRLSGVKAIE